MASGSSWIPLPETVRGRGAVINLNSVGDDCFLLSVAAACVISDGLDTKHLYRVPKSIRDAAGRMEMGGIQLPMRVCNIQRFEGLNPTLRVAVYGIGDGNKIVLVYVERRFGDEERSKRVLLLFLWGDGEGNNHYSPIGNFSRLIATQRLKGSITHTCHNCTHVFGSHELLDRHIEDGRCYEKDHHEVELVEESIEFTNHRKTQTVHFAVYSDSESFGVHVDQSGERKNTMQISRQVRSGLGYCIVGPPGYTAKYRSFPTVETYLVALRDDVTDIYGEWFVGNVPVKMTQGDWNRHSSATKCYRCGWHLTAGENKVVDHDHFTGEYRGAACTECNLLMRKPKFIPVYFHNLEGYDGPMIVREVARVLGAPKCLSRGSQKYITFSVKVAAIPSLGRKSPKIEIRFMDSMKLMSSSLSSLVSTLGVEDMRVTRAVFPDMTSIQSGLMRSKGVYPYDWVDGPDKLEVTSLPPIEDFYNRLTESSCSEEDYTRAQTIWLEFGCRTMQDYHDVYLKSDICQLADVVEKFRGTCRDAYGLDPSWYPTAPGLSWDAMLKITGARLDTISDPDMHLFVESAVRGGISVITKRYSKANHKYMTDYNPDWPSVYISYLDMNNLYGCALADSLPSGGLRWMSVEEIASWRDIVGHTVGDDTGLGCLLEVDLEYPDGMHDEHSDYPMACERMCTDGQGSEKLVPNLNNKSNYIIHHDELRQCLKHGLVLGKVHRGMVFSQSKWMKSYIDMNTRMRSASSTKFEQDFYKLMNNAAFGKTMENVRNRTDIRLVDDRYKYRKMTTKPEYIRSTAFSDSQDDCLIEVEMSKKKTKMDKPVYVGAAVLSISKVRMYEFFYEYVKPKWGSRARLLFTDTDSLCLEIHTEDFYADTAPDVDTHFDTSKIPKDHPAVMSVGFRTGRNSRVLGMMKDEAEGANVAEFVGLRSKSYAVRMEGDDTKDTKKCKGVREYVVKSMTFDEYKDCLFGRTPVYKTQNTMRNRCQEIFVESVTKKALCGEDDKRCVLENRVDTLPWGHYSLRP